MTVKRNYTCDLCSFAISVPPQEYEKRGKGIYWLAENKIEFRELHNAEHHICNDCITALRALLCAAL